MFPAAGASIRDKATRLLSSGAITITEASGGKVTAIVRGDTTTHLVWRSAPGSAWSCTCPASGHGQSCSHILAAALVS